MVVNVFNLLILTKPSTEWVFNKYNADQHVQLLSHVWLFSTHGLQHAKLLYPSSTPETYSNSCPFSWWCHPTISSSVIPFSSCLQSFPASGTSPVSKFFPSGGQRIGVSASASVLPMNIQDWLPLGWTGWTLLAVQATLKSLLQHHSSKGSLHWRSTFFTVQNHIHTWLLEKL